MFHSKGNSGPSPGGHKTDATDHSGTLGAYTHSGKVREAIEINSNGKPRANSETLPKNMSVVWIIKIK